MVIELTREFVPGLTFTQRVRGELKDGDRFVFRRFALLCGGMWSYLHFGKFE